MAQVSTKKTTPRCRTMRFSAVAPSINPPVNRVNNFARSKLESQISEKRKHHSSRVDVPQTLIRNQGGRARRDGEIFCERRPVAHADARMNSDGVVNRRLKKNLFERFCAFEAKVIHVGEAAQFRRQIKLSAQIREEYSGIDEIRLAFIFIRAQIRQQAIAGIQRDARAGQANALAIPQAENAAGKFRKIVN